MPRSFKILIIDDDAAFRTVTGALLEDEGFEIETSASAENGLKMVHAGRYDLILSDLKMTGMSGIEFLQQVKSFDPQIMVIMITGFASIDSAVAAMKLGAEDYLTKPCSNEELIVKIKKALERKQAYEELEHLKSSLIERHQFHHLIGKSPSMQKVYALIEQVAATEATVLIQGETGTGKELVAKAIHFNSQRKNKPFIAVNCAALPETLLESELFGHERGAFSGAIQQKLGRFELAHGGTLFLDEIGDIPLSTQVKLLRVLQEHAFERVGGTKTIVTDIRVIAATNKNLRQEIEQKRFRDDLYFRLNVVPIALPPLRERTEDLPLLAQHFVGRFAERFNKPVTTISEAALKLLLNYHWPGNVRELENVIERAVILSNGKSLEVEHLVFPEQGKDMALLHEAVQKRLTEQELSEIYARMILHELNGNKKEACQVLGINFKTLQKRLREL